MSPVEGEIICEHLALVFGRGGPFILASTAADAPICRPIIPTWETFTTGCLLVGSFLCISNCLPESMHGLVTVADMFDFSPLCVIKCVILSSLPAIPASNLSTNQSNFGRRRPSRAATWQDTGIIIFTTRHISSDTWLERRRLS